MARTGRPRATGGGKERRSTAPAMLARDLAELLAEVAGSERRSVADLVEESPLRIWVLERYAKMKRQLAKQAEAAEREVAELKAKRREG
ncbi:hypothetical protein [Fimbriiglobus ruber]|uniref:Uncharacterized protein n=1 Tax=Fimbriiglobus ruber TaxID=1908690 RepID=A0A225E228_9BACT|nr:hypothetical protein [Fimbriiglobus ruber]OWK45834.1 hypothetical protein FRUB_02165 [Fimbriiglobus ruber]